MIAKILLRALIATVTPATARLLNRLLLDLLQDLAAKTETDLDDRLYEVFKNFLVTSEKEGQ